MQSGQEFLVAEYWDDGDVISFYSHGGLVKIEKTQIQSIEKSDRVYREEVTVSPGASEAPETQSESPAAVPAAKTKSSSPATAALKPGTEAKAGSKAKEGDEEIDHDYYREKRSYWEGELNDTLEQFFEASSNQDQAAQTKLMKEMTDISQKLFDLQEEYKEKNSGELPKWWKTL
jgi:hypothetical protein